jgi:hypothetical protein
VGPRAILDAVVKRKIPSPRRVSNPRTPIVQAVAQRYTFLILGVAKYSRSNKYVHGKILFKISEVTDVCRPSITKA